MFLSSVLVSLFISFLAFGSWFGLLETLYCGHRADRLFFVATTTQHHQDEPRELNTFCSGKWTFTLGTSSIHHRHKISLQVEDWGIPREQKPKR